MLGNKIKGNPNIELVENNDLVTAEKSLVETFNGCFVNVVDREVFSFRMITKDEITSAIK